MSTDKLISFIIPTRRLDFLSTWFDRMEASVADPSCIEVLIKLDTDQDNAKEIMEYEVAKRPFEIRYIITPRIEGQFSIWVAVEQLFFMTNSKSYFIQILSDEPYFLTQQWDRVLRNYIGFFPDHIFRLRLSSMKYANYTSHYECTFRPDSFPIYTRKWLTLTLGTGDCWGSDAFQQCVAFQLSLGERSYKNVFRVNAEWRDVVAHDLDMAGLEFGVGVSPDVEKYKHRRTLKEWKRLSSYCMQKYFSYLASRLYCGIWAHKNNIHEYSIKKDTLKSITKLYDNNNQLQLEVSHDVPIFPVICQRIYINFYFLKRFINIHCLSKIILFFNPPYYWLRWFVRAVSPKSFRMGGEVRKKLNTTLKRFNKWYQAITNVFLKPFIRKQRPPGIKILYGKSKLPPRVKLPEKEEIAWAKEQLSDIDRRKEDLENSLIKDK